MALEKHIRHPQKPREEHGPASEKNIRRHQERTKKKIDKILPEKSGEIEETRAERRKRIEFLLSEETTWADAVHECMNADDFRSLFRTYGMNGGEWQSTDWLTKNGYKNFYRAIVRDPRFPTWNDFKRFMGLEVVVAAPWWQRIKNCKTPNKMLSLIREIGIKGNEWQSTEWLNRNGYKGFYQAVLEDQRFLHWDGFKIFMGMEIAWTKRVRACKTRKQMFSLIRDIGIKGNEWQTSTWLSGNGYGGFLAGIYYDSRFPRWDDFKEFMGIDSVADWIEKIKPCKTKKQMISLIRRIGIKGDKWPSLVWLKKNGYSNFCRAIVADPRFPTWNDFKKFMGLEVGEALTKQVRTCVTKKQMLTLIRSLGIQGNEWRNTDWLVHNGFRNLHAAILKDLRFPSWSIFLAFMDGRLPAKPIENGEQAQKIIEKEIRRLRSEVKWITQLTKTAPITPQEIETMLSDTYYKKNGVARAVADFYRAQEENSQQ